MKFSIKLTIISKNVKFFLKLYHNFVLLSRLDNNQSVIHLGISQYDDQRNNIVISLHLTREATFIENCALRVAEIENLSMGIENVELMQKCSPQHFRIKNINYEKLGTEKTTIKRYNLQKVKLARKKKTMEYLPNRSGLSTKGVATLSSREWIIDPYTYTSSTSLRGGYNFGKLLKNAPLVILIMGCILKPPQGQDFWRTPPYYISVV